MGKNYCNVSLKITSRPVSPASRLDLLEQQHFLPSCSSVSEILCPHLWFRHVTFLNGRLYWPEADNKMAMHRACCPHRWTHSPYISLASFFSLSYGAFHCPAQTCSEQQGRYQTSWFTAGCRWIDMFDKACCDHSLQLITNQSSINLCEDFPETIFRGKMLNGLHISTHSNHKHFILLTYTLLAFLPYTYTFTHQWQIKFNYGVWHSVLGLGVEITRRYYYST